MQRKYRTIPVSDEEFAALFPHHGDRELAATWQVSKAAIQGKARRLGLRKSAEQLARARRLIAEAISGDKHPNWKGGVAGPRGEDERYRPWRQAVLARDRYTCTACGDRRRRPEMHAHHIKSWAEYPDLRYDLDNGITLCLMCHNRLHGREIRPRIKIACKCGCGILIDAVDKWGLAREWARGHSHRGKTLTPEQRAAISKGGEKRRGLRHTQDAKDRIAASKRGRPRTEAELAGFERRKSRWSNKYDCCVSCGRSDVPHRGRGLCLHCHCRERTLRHNPDAGTRPLRHRAQPTDARC